MSNTLKRLDLETSDLFFNLQKEHYDALRVDVSSKDAEPITDQIEREIRKDAELVIANYPRTFDGYTVDEITADFMRRL